MELLLLAASGIPSDSVVSVRAGKTRRQAPLTQVGATPFRFPCKPEDCGSIRVDVFSVLGSARALCPTGEGDYEFRLEPPQAEGAASPALPEGAADGSPALSFKVQATKVQSPHAVDSEKVLPAGKTAAERYLEENGIPRLLQSVMRCLIRDMPPDPRGYVAKHFAQQADQSGMGWEKSAAKLRPGGNRDDASWQDSDDDGLRKQVLGTLSRGAADGSLVGALACATKASQAQGKAQRFRQQARDALVRGAGNGSLASAFEKIRGPSDEQLRRQARETLATGALSGNLAGAMGEARATRDDGELRQQVLASFAKGAASGSLQSALVQARPGQQPEQEDEEEEEEAISDELRQQAFASLTGAAKSGDLSRALAVQARAGVDGGPEGEDQLRRLAFGTLATGARSGELAKALAAQEAQTDAAALRRRAVEALTSGAQNGELAKALAAVEGEDEAELRRLAFETLAAGARSGELARALTAKEALAQGEAPGEAASAPKLPAVGEASSSSQEAPGVDSSPTPWSTSSGKDDAAVTADAEEEAALAATVEMDATEAMAEALPAIENVRRSQQELLELATDNAMLLSEVSKMQALIEEANARNAKLSQRLPVRQ